MTIGVEDGVACIGNGQLLAVSLAASVVTGTTVGSEKRRCLDERPGPGIGTSIRDNPEETAEVDGSKFIWNWPKGFNIGGRMVISRIKGVRTDVGVTAGIGASAGVGETRELAPADPPKVILNDVLAMLGVGTEPSSISGCAARDTPEVTIGAMSVCLGVSCGGDELGLLAG